MPDDPGPRPRLLRRPEVAGKTNARLKLEAELSEVRARSSGHRKLVEVFVVQQRHDRNLRRRYARVLLRVLVGQVIVINILVLMMGWGRPIGFDLDPSTARTIVVAVFLQIAASVGFITRYLFTPTAGKVLDVIDRFRATPPIDENHPARRAHDRRTPAKRTQP